MSKKDYVLLIEKCNVKNLKNKWLSVAFMKHFKVKNLINEKVKIGFVNQSLFFY